MLGTEIFMFVLDSQTSFTEKTVKKHKAALAVMAFYYHSSSFLSWELHCSNSTWYLQATILAGF